MVSMMQVVYRPLITLFEKFLFCTLHIEDVPLPCLCFHWPCTVMDLIENARIWKIRGMSINRKAHGFKHGECTTIWYIVHAAG